MNWVRYITDKTSQLSLRHRFVVGFVLCAISAVVLASLLVYTTGHASIQATLGQTYCQIASRVVQNFEGRVEDESNFITKISTDVLTVEVALEEYGLYRSREEVWLEARRNRLADQWLNSKEVEKQVNKRLSRRLTVLTRLREATIRRLSVYDKDGMLLATNNLSGGQSARSTGWYQAVAGRIKHFSHINTNRDSGTLSIATPIWGGVEIIGYVLGEYNLPAIGDEVSNVRFGETGNAVLVDYAGIPLEKESPQRVLSLAMGSKPTTDRFLSQNSGSLAGPYWLEVNTNADETLWKRLVCVAPLVIVNSHRAQFDLPPWSVVVSQAPDESYAALKTTLDSFAVAGVILVIFLGAIGAIVAWYITKPLRALQMGARSFGLGDRDWRAEVTGPEEIRALATTFNNMAEKVSQSENELRAFAQAVSDATDAIFMTDLNGQIRYINPAFEKITGYNFGEAKNKGLSLLCSAGSNCLTCSRVLDGLRDGNPWRGELEFKRKNGEEYPVDLTFSPIRSADGKMVSLMAVHRDITMARTYQDKLQQEVDERTREIKESEGLTVMGRMASMIAHDLRNALSTVKMTLQILNRRYKDNVDGVEKEHCAMGLEQVRYMEDVVRDMLSYARPDRLQHQWEDVNKIIEGALTMVTSYVSAKNINVVHRENQHLPKVYCDRVKILQVLQNLFANAIQALPEGGALTVKTHLVLNDATPLIEISIRDDGKGMDSQTLKNIFEPFFTTNAKGTGLGLAIVKRIIDQHKGEINVQSALGEGSEFRIILPTETDLMESNDDVTAINY